MLASISWLKNYVDIDCTPEELADKLTSVGLEVEGVHHLGAGISGVITGRVTEIYRHPNSDHLWVCMMDYGQGIVQILTGAQNVQLNDIVPVATVGATLPPSSRNPEGMTLKATKMRGLDSLGMLCSADELGIDSKLLLPEQRNGIYILPADTPIGVDVKTVMGLDDAVLDIDLTANKQDCFCMLGLAREAAAVMGKELRTPDLTVKEEAGGDVNDVAKVDIQAADLCSRFTMRKLNNIKIMPSPAWMQNHLRACGMRPISNVVDVTNYVMLEMGQPMHAYDYDTLVDHHIIVRRGQDGEKFMTLDGQERILDHSMITIADPEKAIGLGGVMGGLYTEVTDKTQNVLLEAAQFYGPSIRRTSKALGLRSEASGRFERGIDVASCTKALDRAANLLEAMGACTTVKGIIDTYPVEYKPAVIRVTPEKINIRIGIEIPKEEMIDILRRLQFTVAEEGAELVITAPTWRQDVTCDADISEEIARMHSFDKIETHMPSLGLVQGRQDVAEDVRDQVEDYMVSAGLDEVMTYSFVHPTVVDKLLLPEDDPRRTVIKIMNPISDEFGVMRTSMVPSLLATASRNLAHQVESVKIFEVGKTFAPKALPLTEFPVEKRILCAVMTGKRTALSWCEARGEVDFYDMKGVVEGLMESLGAADYELVHETQSYLHPGKSCAVKYKGQIIGYFGELHPVAADNFDVPEATYVLELEIAPLVEAATAVPQYTHLPKFPSMSRDIAVVVPVAVTNAELEATIRKFAGELLTDVKVFDIYTGKQVAEGCKSMAFNLTYQAADRTLTDAEVDASMKQVIAEVAEAYKAELRK